MDRNPGIPNLDDADTLEPLRTRTAVVTGASSGIGRAIALRLAQKGAFLHLVGRDEKRLRETRQAAREAGGEADVHTADFEREEDVGALAEQLEREVRAVDILIHSAGVVSLGRACRRTLRRPRPALPRQRARALLAHAEAFAPLAARGGSSRVYQLGSGPECQGRLEPVRDEQARAQGFGRLPARRSR